MINTAYGDLGYIRIPAKEVAFNCVSAYTPATFLPRGSSLTEKLPKRIRVERRSSFPAEMPLIKLIGAVNLQSPVIA